MASVKISQLNLLNGVDIRPEDFFPLVDSSSMTTYHITIDGFNDWFSTNGSASHALYADNSTSASYAISSSYSISSSLSQRAISSSHALTASYFDTSTLVPTLSRTASNLQGFGTSYEKMLIVSQSVITTSLVLATNASLRIPRKLNEDTGTEIGDKNAIWFNSLYGSDVTANDYVRMYFIEPTTNYGKFVFAHGDDVEPSTISLGPDLESIKFNNAGFSWQTESGSYVTASLMFLSTVGRLYTRAVESRDYTSSLTVGVGFKGTSSYAISSSHALLADALTVAPATAPTPAYVKNLVIYPYWNTYDGSALPISITVDDIILHDVSNNAIRLTNVSQINDRSTSGAGGLQGSWTQDEWYDIWVIYNSNTTTSSTVIINSGTTPKQSSISLPTGYDYYGRIGSVKDVSGIGWNQWYEYGDRTRWAWRGSFPSSANLTNGYTITHYLGIHPRNISIKTKLKNINTYTNSQGMGFGDEKRIEDWFVDYGSGDIDGPAIGTLASSTVFKIWYSQHTNGWETSEPSSGGTSDWSGNESFWDLIVYAEN